MHGLCGGVVSTRWIGPDPTAVKVSCHIELCCCCPSCGCSLAARLFPFVWLPLAARLLPLVRLLPGGPAAAPGGWLLPSFCCSWRVAVGCCPRSSTPGGWLLPSFCCLWRLAAALVLPLAAGCCPRSAALVGWLLPSFYCPWRLAAALVLLPMAAGYCPRSAAPGGWLLPSFCSPGGWLLPFVWLILGGRPAAPRCYQFLSPGHGMSFGVLNFDHPTPDTT